MDLSQKQFEEEQSPGFYKKISKDCSYSYKSSPKKLFIKSYFIIWKSTSPIRAQSLKSFLSHLGILTRQVQLLSMILIQQEDILSTSVTKIANLLLFDSFKSQLSSNNFFTSFSLLFGFSLLLSLSGITIQLHLKKTEFFTPFILSTKLITFSLTHILLIPMLINSLSLIRKNGDLNNQFLDSEILKKTVFLLHFLFISMHVLASHLFSYDSDYLTQQPRARSCCVVTFKEEVLVILTCILSQTLEQSYFLMIFTLISVVCFKDYLTLRPYYKESENFLTAALWMTQILLALMSLVENFIGMNGQSLICFIFVTPPGYLLLSHYKTWVKTRVLTKKLENPLIFELKLRSFLLNKREIDEEDIEEIEILFEEATKKFLEFKILPVWECNFVIQVKENLSLAMIKLNKMIYFNKRPKFFEKPEKLFFYPFTIECEFILYSLFKKLKSSDSAKDAMLIKYLQDLKHFKELDAASCHGLLELIDCQLLGSSLESKELDKKYFEFLKSINEKDRFFEKTSKKYGNDHNFVEMNNSFKDELVWKFDGGSSVNSGRTREFYLERLTGNKNIMNVATMILSGNPENLGEVLYANDILLSLLKYPDENSIVGVNYQSFFHEVFSDQLAVFFDYLLVKNQICFSVDQTFLLDFYGYTVEVALEVRMTCLRGSFHFIIYVHQLSSLNYVLLDTFGRVLTCSDKLKSIFTGYQKTINEVLPGFMEILKKQPEDQQFTYIGPTGNFLFQYNSIMAGKERILVVYTSEQDRSLNFYSAQTDKTPLARRKSLTFSGKMMEDVFDFRKSMPVNKRKNRLSDLYKRHGGKFVDLSDVIKKLTKIMKLGNFVAFFILIAIYFGIIIFHVKFVDDSKFAEAVYNVCSIRNTMVTTLISARSIDLLKQGVECGSNFTSYVNKIKRNLNETEKWLKNITIYESDFSTKSLFEDPKIIVYSFSDGASYSNIQNLYDSIYDFNQIVTQLVSNNFSNPDSFLYIYKNGFHTFQNHLNETAYKTFKKIKEKALETFIPVQLMSLFALIPFSIILTCSVLFLQKLQKINSNLTKRVNSIPEKTLALMRTRISDRIKKMHDSRFFKEFETLENLKKKKWIWKKYLFLMVLFVLAVLSFYFIEEYVIHQGYYQIIQNRLNYRFFGGLRTSANQSFLWMREDALKKVQKGFLDLYKDFVEIESEKRMAMLSLEKLRFLNTDGLSKSMKLNEKFNFERFINVLIGNLCDSISFGGCENSYMKNGVYSACEILADELNNFSKISSFQGTKLADLEKMVSFFASNSGMIFDEFDKCANDLQFYRDLAVGLISGIIFFAFFYFFWFICRELKFIRDILLSMNIFLKFYESDKK